MTSRSSRATVQSLTHIWISDDILAEAFNRFVRVSHAHTCRRYGSNVPGPMEARRRQAKRRMGLAAYAGSGSVGTGDFGALFGFGPPRVDWEKEWRWQPPSYEHALIRVPPPPVPCGVWSYLPDSLQPRPGRRELARRYDEQVVDPPLDPVATSANAFEKLLTVRVDKMRFTTDDLKPMLDFLQTSADESEAQNLLSLVKWLSSRSLTDDALQSLLDLIRNKIQLQVSPGNIPVAKAISLLLQHKNAGMAASHFTYALDALRSTSIRKVVTHIARALELRASELPHAAWRDLACLWLSVLDPCVHMQGDHSQSDKWSVIYYHVAARLPVSDLCEHFASLSKRDFVGVLLRHWVPKYMHGETAISRKTIATTSATEYKLQISQAGSSGNFQIIIHEVEARLQKQKDTSDHNGGIVYDTCLTDMLVILNKHRVPYALLLDDIFAVFTATKDPLTVWRLFRDTFIREQLGIGENTAIDLIEYYLGTGNKEDIRRAYWIFDRVKTISATQCSNLPIELIQSGLGTPGRIFAILNRGTPTDTVPVGRRTVLTNALQNAQSDLVELVAFAYAKSQLYTSRVAFRRVWECFRFLQDRKAPLSALMSRAMVRAGIARAMRYDNRYVARTQIQYIISVVNRIEGEEEASKLDRLIFSIKRTRHFDPKGSEMVARQLRRARVTEANLVKQARWRMRRWTRNQSSPWFSMRGVEDGRWRAEDQLRRQSNADDQPKHTASFPEEADETAQGGVFMKLAPDDQSLTALREEIDMAIERENDDEPIMPDAFTADHSCGDDLEDSSSTGVPHEHSHAMMGAESLPGLMLHAVVPAPTPIAELERSTQDELVAFRPFSPSVT